jgi:glutaredoxin
VLRTDGKTERAIFVIDKQGIIRYIDIHDIDKQPSNDELCAVLAKVDPQAAAQAPKPPAEASALPHGGIVMYCTSWCPDCRRARTWLQARNLPCTEVDVTPNRAAAAQVRQWANGNLTTPTFDIDGIIVVDFNAQKLEEALKAKKYL